MRNFNWHNTPYPIHFIEPTETEEEPEKIHWPTTGILLAILLALFVLWFLVAYVWWVL